MSSVRAGSMLRLIWKYLDKHQLLKENPDVKPADIESFFKEAERFLSGVDGVENSAAESCRQTFPKDAAPSQSSNSTAGNKDAPGNVVVYSDGASKGNPGDAGAGFVVMSAGGRALKQGSRYLGSGTNNIAEYVGAIMGLECALELGAREVLLRADSELLVKQLTGVYRVKNAGLKPLHERLMKLKDGFDNFRVEHVPRAQNSEADRLASDAASRK